MRLQMVDGEFGCARVNGSIVGGDHVRFGDRSEEARIRFLGQFLARRVTHLRPLEEILTSSRGAAIVVTPEADLRDLERARNHLGDLTHDRREIVRGSHVAAHQHGQRCFLPRVAIVGGDDFRRGALALGDVLIGAVDFHDAPSRILDIRARTCTTPSDPSARRMRCSNCAV